MGSVFFVLNFSSLLNSGIFFVTFSRTEKRHPHLPHALFRGGDTHNLRHRVEPGSTISSGSTEEGQTNSTDTHTHTLDARNMVHRNPPLPYPFEPNCSAAEPVESSTNFCSCSCCGHTLGFTLFRFVLRRGPRLLAKGERKKKTPPPRE